MTTVVTKTRRTSRQTPKSDHREKCSVTFGDVLTLKEASEYLRISEDEVVRLATRQGLPGRRAGQDWRFLKAALQDWLKQPERSNDNNLFLDLAGKFQNDPFLEEIVADAYRTRGRSITGSK